MASAPIFIEPRWAILAPDAEAIAGKIALRLAPGPGFGDGRHPTTQLCLQAITALAPRDRAWRMLDFGSGCGTLSIAAVLLGANAVDAVEIDAEAIAHAATNFQANDVGAIVRQLGQLPDANGKFDVVVANILCGVLTSFASELTARVATGGSLILSGLVATDVPVLSARYAPLLEGARPEIYQRDEWRALVWRRAFVPHRA